MSAVACNVTLAGIYLDITEQTTLHSTQNVFKYFDSDKQGPSGTVKMCENWRRKEGFRFGLQRRILLNTVSTDLFFASLNGLMRLNDQIF